ncbi:MAG: hypothetical protein NMNS01_11210 [Nitrosomonas sp.]|nr:MAG: hypothetical protein NMNS01_11210 [Nitrosomonas sp.]
MANKSIEQPEPKLEETPQKKFHRATVSFTQNDLNRLDELKTALDVSTNAQTLSMALKLAAEIVKQQELGGKIIFDNAGKQKEMIIAGITKDQ